jgi:hypothetical protein
MVADEVNRPAGECDMVKTSICLRRRPDLTLEAFQSHWRDVHAPIVIRHAATLGIKRYVQMYAIDSPPGGARLHGFDVIGEL